MDKNCLSYWYPRLVSAGVKTPATYIVTTWVELGPLLDGPDGILDKVGYRAFMTELETACIKAGTPCFLRTGHTSGKHEWKDTCYVTDILKLARHVARLVEWSHLVDFIGLPTNVWAAREMLRTQPIAHLPMYGDMPLVREYRLFIKDGKIVCMHPYWPLKAIKDGYTSLISKDENGIVVENRYDDGAGGAYLKASFLDEREAGAIYETVGRVAEEFKGDESWSVDLLDVRGAWYVTDMALAERSYHWDSCENASLFERPHHV